MRWFKRHQHRFIEVQRQHVWVNANFPTQCIPASDFDIPGHLTSWWGAYTLISERCVDQRCRKWRQERLKGHVKGGELVETEPVRYEEL